ncbi:casein kinase I isoform alpha, partial [Favolaschia claudopus]
MSTTAKYTRLPDADRPDAQGPGGRPDTPSSDVSFDDDNDDDVQLVDVDRPRRAAEEDEGEDTAGGGEREIDPRFAQPTPSAWKRAALLLLIVFCFWLAFQLKTARPGKPKVVHANRYSKEFKFRPAASPIITETLKDGRLRVRGGAPTTAVPKPTTPTTAAKKVKAGKRKGKGKGKGKKKRAAGKK